KATDQRIKRASQTILDPNQILFCCQIFKRADFIDVTFCVPPLDDLVPVVSCLFELPPLVFSVAIVRVTLSAEQNGILYDAFPTFLLRRQMMNVVPHSITAVTTLKGSEFSRLKFDRVRKRRTSLRWARQWHGRNGSRSVDQRILQLRRSTEPRLFCLKTARF